MNTHRGVTRADPYTLQQFPEKLAVVRLPPGAEIPPWAESSSLFSITATATETSRGLRRPQRADQGRRAAAACTALRASQGPLGLRR